MLQVACIPMQHGCPITSQTICSAASLSLGRALCTGEEVLRHMGHFVISSGHSYGATDAGASQYLPSHRK